MPPTNFVIADPVTLLERAKERIADISNWTQRAGARNSAGDSVRAKDADACQWCALGALEYPDGATQRAWEAAACALAYASRAMGWEGPVDVNDNGGHAPALEMYDIAIAEMKAVR